jgi:transposase
LAGWDLNAKRSGKKSETVTPVISKRGKAELRYALYQAAFIASIKNQYFVTYYTNKLRGREREKGIKTKMRVKLAAKLLVISRFRNVGKKRVKIGRFSGSSLIISSTYLFDHSQNL